MTKRAKQGPDEAQLHTIGLAEVCVAYKTVAATPDGNIMIQDLLRRFGFTRTTTHVPGDPERSNINEGQRTVMVHIGRLLDADPAEIGDQLDQWSEQ